MIRHKPNRTSTPQKAEFLPGLDGQISGTPSSSHNPSNAPGAPQWRALQCDFGRKFLATIEIALARRSE
jgi:hypothetical protein